MVGWPYAESTAYKADVEANYLKTLELAPEIADRVRAATREERFAGGSVPNFFRKPFGPGWALVGDAGYNKDPITAQGISDAFHDAELCSTAVDEAFDGGRSFEDAMAAYQRTRDARVLPIYEFTTQLATLEPPPPEMQQLLGAVHGNRDAMDSFVSVAAGPSRPSSSSIPSTSDASWAPPQPPCSDQPTERDAPGLGPSHLTDVDGMAMIDLFVARPSGGAMRSTRKLRAALATAGLAAVVAGCGPNLFAWGFNHSGQLGDGTATNRHEPTNIGSASDWTTVSVGGGRTCGLRGTGTLWCWGYNTFGVLGDGTATDRHVPTRIGTATDWTAVSAGGFHTCRAPRHGHLVVLGRQPVRAARRRDLDRPTRPDPHRHRERLERGQRRRRPHVRTAGGRHLVVLGLQPLRPAG